MVNTELSLNERNSIDSDTDATYPAATRVASASAKYNCHSYCWYSQDVSTNQYWLNNPSPYWTDGSYVEAPIAVGRKVRYLSGAHSAIVNYYSSGVTFFRSKWGLAGVYNHAPSYGPPEYNYFSGVKYYKLG